MFWLTSLNLRLIFYYSTMFNVDPLLVCAIVWMESRGDHLATRFERNYKYVYEVQHYADYNNITFETELKHQMTSWGPLQIMGANARVLGFDKPLNELSDENLGYMYGVKFLADVVRRNRTIEDAVSSYNQGSPRRKEPGGEYFNQRYVDEVMEKYNSIVSIFPKTD